MVAQKKAGGAKPAARRDANAGLQPADTKVDEAQRFKGTCEYFNKSCGYGFIKPEKAGVAPDDRVMVHWRAIDSADSWPFLYKGLEVEFNLQKFVKANGSGCYIKAREVTLPGKQKVSLQDEIDQKREYVHSQATRFTGAVKFYDLKKGFGYVTMEDGYANVEEVPKELRVARHEIRSGDEAPILAPELMVEFGIVKNLKGAWACYNVTLPGGELVARNVVEQRKPQGAATFDGEVQFFDRSKGFGYIKPDSTAKFPADVKKSIEEAKTKAKSRLEGKGKDKKAAALDDALIFFRRGDVTTEGLIKRGNKATFGLYMDNRGAGALEVKVKEA
jgi:cold shock CspA family protein